ncbi:MAG: hypothetical protein M1815_002871 [Lichina confinis]|nr:MAG: hypothetical protein M1815_002871 [Lichina confinis]
MAGVRARRPVVDEAVRFGDATTRHLPSATIEDAACRRANTLGRSCSTPGLLFWSGLIWSGLVSPTLGLGRMMSSPHVFSFAAPRRQGPSFGSREVWLVPVHPALGPRLAMMNGPVLGWR